MSENLPDYPFYDGIVGTAPIVHSADTPTKLEQATGLGYGYAETNIVATSDGVAVAYHGPEFWHLRSLLPAREALEAMTFDEARRVRVGGEPVASVEELLTGFPDMRFFLDLKSPAAVRPAARLINRLALHDRVAIGGSRYAFTQAAQEEVRPAGPVCTSIGTAGSIALLLTRFNLTAARAESYIRQSEATHFMLPFRPIRSDTTERAHSRGMRVFAWAPAKERRIAATLARDVDGIMSDEIAVLKALTDRAETAD